MKKKLYCMRFLIVSLMIFCFWIPTGIKADEPDVFDEMGRCSLTADISDDGSSITFTIGNAVSADGFRIYVKEPGSSKFTGIKTLKNFGKKEVVYTYTVSQTGEYVFKAKAYGNNGSGTVWGKYSKKVKASLKAQDDTLPASISPEGYTLQQVVILSRHNIRAPLSTKGSTLDQVTPYKWYKWSSGASELSLRGGVLETEMGQYFRKWLENEKLIPENYHPEGEEVRFYSNSKQRTIATSRYFSAGFSPSTNVEIEYHMDFDVMDPVFTPDFNFTSTRYAEDVRAQINSLFAEKVAGLESNFELMAGVLDMKKSDLYKDYKFSKDFNISVNLGAEPGTDGSLKLGTQISDALVLQFYEEENPQKAAFGKDLTIEQWAQISEIKDLYGDVLFTAPIVAANVAYPLVKEIYSEMNTEGRVFTFLCGHDSNLGSVLSALNVKDYALPYAIEKKTPIGSKLVFSKWTDRKGRTYWSVDMVYQSVEQLRTQPILDLNNPPVIYHMEFSGIKQNKDGLYRDKDIKKLFTYAFNNYEALYNEYIEDAA